MIAWFAENHVASNLLMFGILFAGILTVPNIRQTVFPDFDTKYVSATVIYPGAAPEDIEKAVTIRVEEEIQDLEGIEEIFSSANEGATNIMIELIDSADTTKSVAEIETRIDGITTFPQEIEEPIVKEILFTPGVVDIVIYGPADEKTLKRLAQKVREDLASLREISQVTLRATRPYEVSIEVSQAALQQYGLRFDEVATAVRRSSLDLPGGNVKTDSGEILLRTDGQAYWREDFERIPVVVREDGSRVMVADVARVIDGFEEGGRYARFDGQPAVYIELKRVGEQRVLDVAHAAKAYVERERANLPAGIQMALWDDDSAELETQIDMMLRNATFGFVLVIGLLAVFLKLRVAFWVAVGIPVSIAGGLALMPHFGLGINILTVFSFIMALGILVDDAIVTGENIYTHQERDPGNPLRTAISGAQEVATPVIFGVLTTIAAFAPFSLIQGQAKFMTTAIGGVMVGALIFSLVESKLVLPSHLAHWSGDGSPPRTRITIAWARFQSSVARGLRWFIEEVYGPAARLCVEWRYLTAATSFGIFVVAIAAVGSGHVKSSMHPSGEMNVAFARLTMPLGTPSHETVSAIAQLEESAEALRRELNAGLGPDEPLVVEHVFSMVGTQSGDGGPPGRRNAGTTNVGQVTIGLSPIGDRSIGSKQIADLWRERVGAIPGVEELTFLGSFHQFGDPIQVELRGDDPVELESAAEALVKAIERYPGVYDVRDSHREGKEELRIDVLPAAEALGITREDIGRQVRQAFYGAEAQRMQRGRDEVKVMIRYPFEERRSITDVESLRIRLPNGTAAPLGTIARVERTRGPASIFRHDRKRKIDVRANLDDEQANAEEIIADVERHVLPAILLAHPSVSYGFGGEQQEAREAFSGLRTASWVALASIFALLAIPLRSYIQPLVIMLAIPFGYVGAVLGHAITGFEMTFLSLVGVLACAGVVVNDSLVLVTFLNRIRGGGESLGEAAVSAGQARFRAIMLTSITTFGGLLPIMLERSAQAQFVIPMAISLAFGVMVATIFTLLLVPAAIVIADDCKQAIADALHWLSDLYRDDGPAQQRPEAS